MRIGLTSGSLFNGLAIIGAGAAVILPDQKWIGGIIIAVGVLALIFDIKAEHGHVEIGSPRSFGKRLRAMSAQIMMLAGVLIFLVGAFWYFLPTASKPSSTVPPKAAETVPPQTAEASAQSIKPEPTGIYKHIADGLTKARADLLGIKKDDLSCDELSAWQKRADTSTRLAHANGIGIHNPISQHVGACRNITDTELLDAIRMTIVQLLDQGIEATKGR